MTYRELQIKLKQYKDAGLTEIRLNSCREVLEAELERLTKIAPVVSSEVMEVAKPFKNNREHDQWTENNCDKCKKYPAPDDQPICQIEDALFQAYWGNRTISLEIWERMGKGTKTCPEKIDHEIESKGHAPPNKQCT